MSLKGITKYLKILKDIQKAVFFLSSFLNQI